MVRCERIVVVIAKHQTLWRLRLNPGYRGAGDMRATVNKNKIRPEFLGSRNEISIKFRYCRAHDEFVLRLQPLSPEVAVCLEVLVPIERSDMVTESSKRVGHCDFVDLRVAVSCDKNLHL